MTTQHPNSVTSGPRSFLGGLEGYVPGEQPRGGGYTKLNTNEFPYPASSEVIAAIQREATDSVRVYPDPTARALREALATRHGVEPDNILVGNGSDEILRYLAHAWLGAGRRLAVVQPTYTLYEVLAAMFEAQVDVHPLEGEERLPASLRAGGSSACFLPVPNPPLGTLWRGEDLLPLAETGGLLVLDGAYIDFIDVGRTGAPVAEREPLPIRATIERAPNIVFTRTFSKSFGLAGMRIGYVIAATELIHELHKLRDSYNLNRISQAAALAALESEAYYRARCDEIIASRRWLAGELGNRGFRVYPSQANLVFARLDAPRAGLNAKQIYEALKARKVLVRWFGHSGLENGLRITIGTPEECATLLYELDAILEAQGA